MSTTPTKEDFSDASLESASIDLEAERRAIRKLDCTLLPVISMYYLLSFLDRSNIGNARVAGLQRDLHMTDYQYQLCLTMLYIPYILSELPANLILKRITPTVLMPTLLTSWGLMVTFQGFVKSYAGLMVVRVLLGLAEGPMFPGIVLYLSGFYTRKELSLRIAIFFSTASLSGAFSGLLAAAIQKMHGLGGRPGWAWIFILEGIFSVFMGLIGYFLTPSSIRGVRFLTEQDKDILERRLQRDRPIVNPVEHFRWKEVVRALTSLHVIIIFFMFYMSGAIILGLGLFLPTIVNSLGFTPVQSQLLSVGPNAGTFVVVLVAAYFSDKYQTRSIPIAALSMLAVIGYAIYLTAETRLVSYGAMFFAAAGAYSAAPIIGTWNANNSEPWYARGTTIATGFISSNMGGLTSTWMFPSKDGPKWTRTTIINLVFVILIAVLAIVNRLHLQRLNRIKKERRDELLAPFVKDGKLDENLAWFELGDRHPDFEYAY